MLAYKLKHLCSQVIASLSAVGLISIAGTGQARATTLTQGQSVTNSFAVNTTFTATYSDTLECDGPADDPRIATGIAGTNKNGDYVCTYILKPGYAPELYTGNCVASGKATYYNVEAMTASVCTEARYTGVSEAGGYSGTMVSYLVGDQIADDLKGAYLYEFVQDQYEANNVVFSQSVVTVPRESNGTAPLPSGITKKQIRINFSCGKGTYVRGQTGVAYVPYGESFVAPSATTCDPANGTVFKEWSDGK